MSPYGLHHDEKPPPRRLSADRARLVGRLLRQTEPSATTGEPNLVSLRGDAGQGKSTMLDSVVTEARARGRSVVRMAGGALSAGMPYAALYDMVTDPANALGPRTRGIADQLASFQASSSPLAVSYAIGSWLQDLSRERPAILLVDDADLVDEDSLRVVAYAVTRYTPDTTSVLYALTRPVPLLDRLQVPQVRLKDLSHHEAVSLAVEAGASEDCALRLVTRLGGNPLALLHAAAACAEQYGSAHPKDVPVAARLERDVTARMDPLAPHARRVLAGSAVTGEVSLDRLAVYVEESPDSLDDVLEGIEQSGLVRIRRDHLKWRRLWMSAAVAGRCDAERRQRLTAVLERRRPEAAPAAPGNQPEPLTVSERRVVEVIIAGASIKDAADQLFISARTVGSHLQNAYRKLGIHSRSQLAALLLPGESTGPLAVAV
ncbi:MAG TPA: LuxR family transcriptional regulator [Propionibacteriaceae bacterium]|nr:LuxR family transcriptional regulator [Propionibacteriaceae bacterium]